MNLIKTYQQAFNNYMRKDIYFRFEGSFYGLIYESSLILSFLSIISLTVTLLSFNLFSFAAFIFTGVSSLCLVYLLSKSLDEPIKNRNYSKNHYYELLEKYPEYKDNFNSINNPDHADYFRLCYLIKSDYSKVPTLTKLLKEKFI